MLDEPAPAELAEDETAVASSVGSSKMSDNRSTFLANCIAFFRLSNVVFPMDLLYVVEKRTASSSSFGIAFCSDRASFVICGMESLRVERLSEDVMKALCERLERDWRDSSVE